MKGIREMAMSKPKKPPKKAQNTYYDRYFKEPMSDPYLEKYGMEEDGLDYSSEEKYEPLYFEKDLEEKTSKNILITIKIERNRFKSTFIFQDIDYSYSAIEKEAETMAYDEIKELLKESYEQKYMATYETKAVYQSTQYVKVLITLKPITKK